MTNFIVPVLVLCFEDEVRPKMGDKEVALWHYKWSEMNLLDGYLHGGSAGRSNLWRDLGNLS